MSSKTFLVPIIAVVCITVVFLAGCTGPVAQPQPTPVSTPVPTQSPAPAESNLFDQTNNGGTYNIPLDSEISSGSPRTLLQDSPGISLSHQASLS